MQTSFKLGAAATVALATVALSSGTADAIRRLSCSSTVLELVSNQPTCWADAGSINVTLYSVYSFNAGNPGYTGYFLGHDSTYNYRTNFAQRSGGPVPTQTVTFIDIS